MLIIFSTEISMLADQKKSSSFASGHSGTTEGQQPLMQSVVSLAGAHSESGDEPKSHGKKL